MSEANICVLLKKDKDETDPGNCRPIALLNCDLKIIKVFAKGWATIASIIHPDQTGFVPDMFSCNVCKILNVLYAVHDKVDNPAILSLDAQKAFDMISRLSWRPSILHSHSSRIHKLLR